MEILILEDDIIWQLKLRMMLEELNLGTFEIIDNITLAQKKLSLFPPDLVIADIVLADGLAFDLLNNHSRTFPVVYITINPTQELLDKALSFPKSTFLVKPFHPFSLLAAIRSLGIPSLQGSGRSNGVWVIGKFKQKVLLPFEEICYIESDGNYVSVSTKDHTYTFKQTLKKILEQVDGRFIRIHRSYIINSEYVKRIDLSQDFVIIGGRTLSIGRAFRSEAVKKLIKLSK